MDHRPAVRVVSLGLLSTTCALVITLACGSEDNKKKSPGPTYNGGGEPGAGGSSTEPQGGNGGTEVSTGGDPATAGTGATTTEGGAPSSVGGAGGGTGGPGDGCPDGFGDCDDDPSHCETPLDTLIQCGACNVSCSDTNGSVACEDGKCVMTECTASFGDCDEDGTNGCELALAEDDANCGECGRDCAAGGATCNTGGCTAVVIDPSASGFLARFAGGAMYIMGSGAMPVSNYTLVRIPVDGSARKTVWAASANVGNGALYADESDVYWGVSGTPPSVLKKAATDPADALPTVVFQPDAQAHYLTAQGANFYWANSTTGLIYARAKTAPMATKGAAIVNVDQGSYSGFVTSPTRLYFVAQDGAVVSLKTVAIPAGGTPTDVPGAVVAANAPLMTVGEKLYFVRSVGNNALNGLYEYSPGDAEPKQLVAHDRINSFMVDDNAIFYKYAASHPVYKTKLTGGAGKVITSGNTNNAFAGQDDTYLYMPKDWGSGGPLVKVIK